MNDDYIPSYAKPRNSKPKVLKVETDEAPPSPVGNAVPNYTINRKNPLKPTPKEQLIAKDELTEVRLINVTTDDKPIQKRPRVMTKQEFEVLGIMSFSMLIIMVAIAFLSILELVGL